MPALLTVFNSWALLETRRLVQVFPVPVRKLWNNWEVRVLVLVSLTLQLCLLHFGSRRRYSVKTWLRVFLWLSYLGADSVATVALGVISNKQGNSCNCNDSQSQNELIAFWAPFLLLHLGGQDTITAYAVQDNELWLRHLVGLVVQSVLVLYIILLSWKGSSLSSLTIQMFAAGLIKYAERTYVLKSANNPIPLTGLPMAGRRAMFWTTYPSTNSVDNHPVDNQPVVSLDESNIGAEIGDAFLLFKVFRFRFLNQKHQIFISQFGISSNFSDSQTAWNTIEDELGYSYDVYYTKAPLFFTAWGFVFRLISFTCIVLVFLVFLVRERHKHPQIDLVITYLLLVGAVLMEIYAGILLCGSDWPLCGSDWLRNTQGLDWIRNTDGRLIKLVTHIRIGFAKMTSKKKWSNSVGQLSLLGLYFKEKCLQDGHGTPKLLAKSRELALKQMLPSLDIRLKVLFYRTNKQVSDMLKELVFTTLSDKRVSVRGDNKIDNGLPVLMEDYQCIIVWHIVTDLWFDKDCDTGMPNFSRVVSKEVSDYMMYILAMCPFVFSTGNVKLCFESCCKWLDNYCLRRNVFRLPMDQVWENFKSDYNREFGVDRLSTVASDFAFGGELVGVAVKIVEDVNLDDGMWENLSKFWVENLIYVASLSQGNYHAQLLRNGGEFLSHVWLLIENLDLTESIKKSYPIQWPLGEQPDVSRRSDRQC